VIAADRTILYAEVNPDYRLRPEPEDMFAVIKKSSAVKAA
jgi:hypothetical protein